MKSNCHFALPLARLPLPGNAPRLAAGANPEQSASPTYSSSHEAKRLDAATHDLRRFDTGVSLPDLVNFIASPARAMLYELEAYGPDGQ